MIDDPSTQAQDHTAGTPLLPLRDLVVFPHMVVPLVVGRPASKAALRAAEAGDRRIVLLAQRSAGVDEPDSESLFEVGCVAKLVQLVSLPDGNLKALVEGVARARVLSRVPAFDHVRVEHEDITEPTTEQSDEVTEVVQTLKEVFEEHVKLSKALPPEMMLSVAAIDEPAKLADVLVAHLDFKLEDRQALLEEPDAMARLQRVHAFVTGENEILQVERKIKKRVRRQIERSQKEHYLNEQMEAIQKELGEKDDGRGELAEFERRIKEQSLSADARHRLSREVRKLRQMSPMSAEASVIRNYVETVLSLPWETYSEDETDLRAAAAILDEDHFGLEQVKERILEYLAVSHLVERQQGPVLCLVGPPGVGKTSLARSVARATGRSFVRQALGGVRDEAEIRGHRRTYIGALPGKIIQGMKRAENSNPVFLLDEVDKMSSDFRGDPSSALLEVLDPEQNTAFNDHYLDLDYDLSKAMFICTANDLRGIPRPLEDRLETIQLAGYTEAEKLAIAQRYLLPKQREAHGITEEQLSVPSDVLTQTIRRYTREAGVRSLERSIARLCRKVARRVVEEGAELQLEVSVDDLSDLLGVPPYLAAESNEDGAVGVVHGLAVSAAGGVVLNIEVAAIAGSGRLLLTGGLGDTLRESAHAGLSYIRSRREPLGLEKGFYTRTDVHVHFPGTSAKTDGPSAGIAMVTAMTSALAGIPVRPDVALTGEVSLLGRVLPVGGIKEKILAAHRRERSVVIIPRGNEKDLVEVPDAVLEAVEVVLVDHMDAVLGAALQWPDGQQGFDGSAQRPLGFGR